MHGQFFQDEVYLIDIKGDNHRYLLTWIGPRLSAGEIAPLSDYALKHTDYVMTLHEETRLFVQQGHEDDTLLKFFPHFIAHDGPHLSFAELQQKMQANGAMYRIQGHYGMTPIAYQQDQLLATNLNSTESFFVVQPGSTGHSWAWNGLGSSEDEKLYAGKMAKVLNLGSCDVIAENGESDDFWAALGGKTEYASSKELNIAPGFDPRLFFFSIAGGFNHFKEIPNYVQDDLCNENVMVMDAYSTIWVWVGRNASKLERRKVAERVDTYINALHDGRTPDKI